MKTQSWTLIIEDDSLLFLLCMLLGSAHCSLTLPQRERNICTSSRFVYSEHTLDGIFGGMCPVRNRESQLPDLESQWNKSRRNKKNRNMEIRQNITHTKVILFWTSFFERQDFEFGFGKEPFLNAGCEYTNCITTINKQNYSTVDAIIFHLRNVAQNTIFPVKRFPHQSYVFFNLENPHNQWNDLSRFNGFFNLTMSYRKDSDIPILYGKTVPMTDREKHDFQSAYRSKSLRIIVEGKEKLVAWFASNCGPTRSRREEYVKELQKYIPVDVYGTCGPLKCPVNAPTLLAARRNEECYEMLEKKYKFYLSFENNYCKDYITEKFFNILNRTVVPIVYGGGDYTRDSPAHSYINIEEFPSPKHLAQHLLNLDKDDESYMRYFDWKMEYSIWTKRAYTEGFCKLCKILNADKKEEKVYDSISTWWDKSGSCDLNRPAKLRGTYEN